MNLLRSIFVLTSVTVVLSKQLRFDNYRVYEASIENAEQLQVLQYLERFPDGYSFWEFPAKVGMKVRIMVPPHKIADFEALGARLEMTSTVKIANVQKLIDNERPLRTKRVGFGWDDYHTLDEMYEWIDSLVAQYENVLSVELVGHSYEGREVRAVKLSHKVGNPGIFLESNIHAREWITSATTTWILNELLTSTDPQVMELAQNYDWYILPVVNPDGLNYTKEVNRMWRKTRYPHNILCYGVDMNRNFPYHWMDGGSTINPCSDVFAGPEPASEIETRNILEYFTKYKDQIHFYLSFHSYGQLILLPFGYENAEKVDNFYDWMEMAEAAAIALYKRSGTQYTFGNTAEVLYIASGSTIDWALGEHNVPIAAAYEFRDQGNYEFLLPADQIIPNSEEVLDSLVAFLSKARDLGYFIV
ncbi:zinc carboxypeptidase-like [Topomyia yanbarensis]|uniref:zinc carboxypeptidase-like n=1 Tax=Topomyia yanbarensis TaxID=2498891 RepID=UPI00273BFA75|nr:zinc carboxypeptidase-like [Topomyia yanbarensis]